MQNRNNKPYGSKCIKNQLSNIDWDTVYQVETCGDKTKIIPFDGNEYYIAATLADIFYKTSKRTCKRNSNNRKVRNFILTHLYIKQKT